MGRTVNSRAKPKSKTPNLIDQKISWVHINPDQIDAQWAHFYIHTCFWVFIYIFLFLFQYFMKQIKCEI